MQLRNYHAPPEKVYGGMSLNFIVISIRSEWNFSFLLKELQQIFFEEHQKIVQNNISKPLQVCSRGKAQQGYPPIYRPQSFRSTTCCRLNKGNTRMLHIFVLISFDSIIRDTFKRVQNRSNHNLLITSTEYFKLS